MATTGLFRTYQNVEQNWSEIDEGGQDEHDISVKRPCKKLNRYQMSDIPAV